MDAAGDIGKKVMWRPDHKKRTNILDFKQKVNTKYCLDLETYADLYKWSTDNYPQFWEEVWKFTDIIHSKSYDQVVDENKRIDEVPEWFHGSRLNYAENMLRCDDDRVAIYAAREGVKEVRKLTFRQVRENVAKYAAAMRKIGIEKGDRVVGYIPNCPEALEAMLAAASIGAIWSSTSPDFGVSGVLDRFTQIKPKLIFSVNAVRYNGKRHNHMEKIQQVVKGLPELEKVVIIPFAVENGETLDISGIANGCTLGDFLDLGLEDGEVPDLQFEQLPFNHPLFIMYSSGTTGAPKCMIHSAGGTLIQHLKEHVILGNLSQSDIILYYTTTGWMMWNWLVTAMAAGAAIVTYDGSPFIPTPNVLWDLIDEIGITIFGTSAKWIAVLEDREIYPARTHKLTSLHSILSTGSPLKPQSYEYVYKEVKKDLLLGSITGGTDIVSCFAGANWDVPVYKGEIQARNLGMAIESWDENGKLVYNKSGELVCLKPFPSMPTSFWNDPDGAKYKKAYFDKYEGVWAHGDFVTINAHTGGILMLGRSDGTLNPSGVRFGSAEIYNIVETFKEILDSVCVSQRSQDNSEERVILFLKMAPGIRFSEELVKRLRAVIRQQLSARHVPTIILPIEDIPYTQNGKKVEVAIRKVLAGQDVTYRGAYANPGSLDLYKDIPELQGY
ncbi:acetoacetyl-CoA synthetase-like [Lineus longissimus]|uniref:acetoacetyl-CoA synthetase-like n=1 Tax=Lineus longissimus TaxID=88925 RepID=UPI002B4CCC1C